MPENTDRFNVVACSVLREADYRPGNWVLSDRHNKMSLFCENTDAAVNLMKDNPSLELCSFLVLVREQLPGQRWARYAKPFTAGPFAFGGNWLWSNDSRFPADHPIPIHDASQPG